MRQHDTSESEPVMSKMAAEHRRVSAPPPPFPMLRDRGWVGAMVAERAVRRDVRDGDVLAILKGDKGDRTERGAVGPATPRGGRRVVAGDGTNSLLMVGPSSGVEVIAPVYRWRCAAQPRRGRSVQPSQRAGLEEDWWTWEPAQ